MDFETAVRERIPILSILLNNFSMAIELKVMPVSTEKYRSTDISGDYAAMARAFGGYGERVDRSRARSSRRSSAASQQTKEGVAGAARVHHQQGNRGFAAGDLRSDATDCRSDAAHYDPGDRDWSARKIANSTDRIRRCSSR